MARRIAALACLSGLAGANPYKGREAKDRIIDTALKRNLQGGAAYIEAYCGSGEDIMTCFDTRVLLHLGEEFNRCWDIDEHSPAQCTWTIGQSSIGETPRQCGAQVVERAKLGAERRVLAKFPGQNEHANRGYPAGYEHSASAIMMYPADEESQRIFKGTRTRRVGAATTLRSSDNDARKRLPCLHEG